MQYVRGYHLAVKDFGLKLKRLREGLDLRQIQIARRLTTTKTVAKSFSNYLSRIERGDDDQTRVLTGNGAPLPTALYDLADQLAKSEVHKIEWDGCSLLLGLD